MPSTLIRSGPYGNRLIPSAPFGNTNWDASGLLSFTLLSAGHEPGLYSIDVCAVVLVAAGTGTLRTTANWDQPGLGAATFNLANASSLTAIPGGFQSPRHVVSSGRSPILLSFVPNAVTGAPRVRIDCGIEFILAKLPLGYPS